ncbi:type VI secretion system secreted protein VgrG [Phyllobacterium myrsinacearum]|uniref:type VI secretion system Vgr family protein n=1 Tax=Phyllobacterium myrsinacearum TaxID=28101 RepID=UPI00102A61C8|nr:type VI secretion system tip protein TssI/VgrG [Phyllobacterium myrsinacearum]RZS76777.1 type VI secretion system secreted protein VgrG [Phyllobacterium myrsinacearum]
MNIISDAGYIQATRILRIQSPLGPDVLLPERFEANEEISGLFEIALTVKSKKTDLKANDIVGKTLDIELETGEGQYRPWNGLVTELMEGPPVTRGLRAYRMVLRPQLWLLSQRSDCRIWLDKTSIDVLQMLLSEHGIKAAVTGGVINPPKPQHYSVQWNETDLAFLTRRLEEDGIFYWFEHVAGAHTLHVATHTFGYTEGSETNVRYAAGSTDRNHIGGLEKRYVFTPGKRTGADWNFETPKIVPKATSPSLVSLPKSGEYELYEYPARALNVADNEAASQRRMQAVEADHERVEGHSTVRTLAAGRRFKPYDVAHPDQAHEEFVVTRIVHTAIDPTYETNDGAADYSNSFHALPSRVPATPHRSTPRPRIDGTHIGLIAGPPGEEIHVDQYGRVKLWFPWDRRAQKDGSDTKWVEVVQSWGGGTWGARVNPRIGMQAICSHENGDPDRPYVIGLVANADNKVPYNLPAHKTKSSFRTNTHKGNGFNEMSFEDDNGQENFFLHAQKDMTSKVLNNQIHRVDANAMHSTGANHQLEVGANMNQQVGGGMNLVVGAVGGAAASLLGGGLSGLMAQSSGLLSQAMGIAMQAVQSAGGSAASKAAGAAQAVMGAAGVQNASQGSEEAQRMGGVAEQAGSYGASLGASTLAAIPTGFDDARGGVNGAKAPGLRAEGGKSMAGAGSKIAESLAGLIGSGVRNTTIGQMDNINIGAVSTEQVGAVKITTVGQVAMEKVGHTKKLTVGEEYTIEVGKSLIVMKKDGTIIIKGVKFHFEADGPYQMIGGVIDSN